MLHLFFVPCSTTVLYVPVRYSATVLRLYVRYVKQETGFGMYNYNNKNSSTVGMKMVFTRPPPHHHQQQGDQHEAQISEKWKTLVRKN